MKGVCELSFKELGIKLEVVGYKEPITAEIYRKGLIFD